MTGGFDDRWGPGEETANPTPDSTQPTDLPRAYPPSPPHHTSHQPHTSPGEQSGDEDEQLEELLRLKQKWQVRLQRLLPTFTEKERDVEALNRAEKEMGRRYTRREEQAEARRRAEEER